MKHTFTPGPWTYNPKSVVLKVMGPDVGFRGGDHVCTLADNDKANARLIAQAPAMLEALRELLTHVGLDPNGLHAFSEDVQKARAILRAVEG